MSWGYKYQIVGSAYQSLTSLSRDGVLCAVKTNNLTIDVKNGSDYSSKKGSTITSSRDAITSLVLSGDGNTVAIGYYLSHIDIYKFTSNWSLSSSLNYEHSFHQNSLSLSHDGNILGIVGTTAVLIHKFTTSWQLTEQFSLSGLSVISGGFTITGNGNIELSANGNAFVIGLPYIRGGGLVRVYKQISGIWQSPFDFSDNTLNLTSVEYGYGNTVTISDDGNIIATGAHGDQRIISLMLRTSGLVDIYKYYDTIGNWARIGRILGSTQLYTGNQTFGQGIGYRVSLSGDGRKIVSAGSLANILAYTIDSSNQWIKQLEVLNSNRSIDWGKTMTMAKNGKILVFHNGYGTAPTGIFDIYKYTISATHDFQGGLLTYANPTKLITITLSEASPEITETDMSNNLNPNAFNDASGGALITDISYNNPSRTQWTANLTGQPNRYKQNLQFKLINFITTQSNAYYTIDTRTPVIHWITKPNVIYKDLSGEVVIKFTTQAYSDADVSNTHFLNLDSSVNISRITRLDSFRFAIIFNAYGSGTYTKTVTLNYYGLSQDISLNITDVFNCTPLSLTLSSSSIQSPDTSCNMTVVFDYPMETFNSSLFAITPAYIANVDISTFTSSLDKRTWVGKLIRTGNMNRVDNQVSVTSTGVTLTRTFDVIENISVLVNAQTKILDMSLNATNSNNLLYGYRVAISDDGNRFAMSRPIDNSVNVYNYQSATGSWIKLGNTITDASYEYMGSSLAMSSTGNRLAIGMNTYNTGVSNNFKPPRVLVFDWTNNSSWVRIGGVNDMSGVAYKSAANPLLSVQDNYGHAMAMSSDGTVLVIGAPSFSDVSANNCYVKIYNYNGSNWLLTATISQLLGTRFGTSVALSADGTKLAVGAPRTTVVSTIHGRGHIYHFRNPSWVEVGVINGSVNLDMFGISSSISSNGLKVVFGGQNNTSISNLLNYAADSSFVTQVLLGSNRYQISMSSDGSVVASSIPINIAVSGINVRQIVVQSISNTTITNTFSFDSGTTANLYLGEYLMLSRDGSRLIVGSTRGIQVYQISKYLNRRITSFSLNPSAILISNPPSALTINFSTNSLATIADISNNFSINPTNVATITDLSSNNYGFAWTGNVRANSGASGNGNVLRYTESAVDLSSQLLFNVDGVIPQITTFSIDPSNILYTSPTSRLTVQFNKYIDLSRNQISFTPSDVILTPLVYNSSTFTYTSDVTFPYLSSTTVINYTSQVNVSNDMSSNLVVACDTYIPRVSSASLLSLTYLDVSGIINIQFDKPLLVDLSANHITNLDSSLSVVAITKLTSQSFNVKLLATRYNANRIIQCQYYGITSSDISVNISTLIPRISDISLNSKIMYFDSRQRDAIVTFDNSLLDDDETNILLSDADTTNYSISDIAVISNTNRTQVSLKYNVLNYEVFNANKTMTLSFRGVTRDVSNILVDTRIPTLDISLSSVENLLYTDVSSQIVLKLNDTTEYFKTRYAQALTAGVTVDASLLMLTMNENIDNDGVTYRGYITCASGCFYPDARLRFQIQETPININSSFAFRVDTRLYQTNMSFSKADPMPYMNYLDTSGTISLQLTPFNADYETNISMNNFSIYSNDVSLQIVIVDATTIRSVSSNPQIELKSDGSFSTNGLWQGVFSISGEITSVMKIQYNQLLVPLRSDGVIEYRQCDMSINVVKTIPRISDISLNSNVMYFDSRQIMATVTFDHSLLEGDETNLQLSDVDTTNYSIADIAVISDKIVSLTYHVLNYEIVNANKTMTLSFRGVTKDASNIVVDTRIPTLNISLSSVENLLYTDVSSQIVLTLNDTTNYFFNRNQQSLSGCVTVDASLLTLNMESSVRNDGTYRGSITCGRECYFPHAKVRFQFDQTPIIIDSLFAFRVDTREYQTTLSYSNPNINYLDTSGILSLQLSPFNAEYDTDVSMNNFSFYADEVLVPMTVVNAITIRSVSSDPQITLTSNGSYSPSGQWQGVLSISGEVMNEMKIKYKELLHPLRSDAVIEYREDEIWIDVDTIIPSISEMTFSKSVLTYLDQSGIINISFDRDVLDSTLSLSTKVNRGGQDIDISFSALQPTSSRNWSTSISVVRPSDSVLDMSINFHGKKANVMCDLKSFVPEVSGNILIDREINYLDTSANMTVHFKHNVYDLSSVLISYFNIPQLFRNHYDMALHETSDKRRWEGSIDFVKYNNGQDRNNASIDFSYPYTKLGMVGENHSTAFDIKTAWPIVTDITLSSDKITYDASQSSVSIAFSKPLLANDLFSIANNVDFSLSSVFSMNASNLMSVSNARQLWSALLSPDLNVNRKQNNILHVNYRGTRTNSLPFMVDTIMRPKSNICFLAGEMVWIDEKGYIAIENVMEGVDQIDGHVVKEVTSTQTEDKTMTLIRKDSFAFNLPHKDTYISNHHKVLYRGEMMNASLIEYSEQVKYNGETMYNILLEEEGEMMVNGLRVETLSPSNNISRLYEMLSHSRNRNRMIELYNTKYLEVKK
jgi:hypothetical protein